MRRKIAITLPVGLLLVLQGLSWGEALDGSVWKNMNELSKATYCRGVVVGAGLVYKTLEKGITEVLELAKKNAEELEKADLDARPDLANDDMLKMKHLYGKIMIELVSKNMGELLAGVGDKLLFPKITVGQIKGGMDVFYTDFSNERIRMIDALYVVKMQINGVNSKLIEAQSRYLRMMPNVQIMSWDEYRKAVEQMLEDKSYQALVRSPYFYCVWDTSMEKQVVRALPEIKQASDYKDAVKRGLKKGWITREHFIKVGFHCGENGNLQRLFYYGDYK